MDGAEFETYIVTAQKTFEQLLAYLRQVLPEQTDLADQAQEQLALLLGRLNHDLPLVAANQLWELRAELLHTQAQATALEEQLVTEGTNLTTLEDRRTGDLDRIAVLQEELNTARAELCKSIERELVLQTRPAPDATEAQVLAELLVAEQKSDALETQLAIANRRVNDLETQLTLAQQQVAQLQSPPVQP
uniref:hypothetical protein n=1 Tax=Candidatus Cyanaurora vandensis TaxID=2714958 RepID=UPI00257BD09C